ncbi:hypothetical protein H6A03_02140 [[Clostridium] spiroforme]|nr:hypothetical protein [Thomasclavelia spiroformis]MBM6879404.1 hypothetical protein [Thomasclavelia spiroformis]
MQLLYANDGINYRTINKSSSLSSGAEKVLLGSYMKYDFVSNADLYSSVSKEPEALTYAVSNLNNELNKDYLIISKTGHMSNFSTPCYYFHALLKDVSDDFFKDDFFEIFNYQFIEDKKVNQYQHENIDHYQFSREKTNTVVLNDEQLIAILATFMNNEKSNRKTKIIVDAKGDAYNQRSRAILASIYHYLPYELRKRYGFLSYSRDENGGAGRISFVLYPKEEIRNINTSFIDLTASDFRSILRRIDNKYIQYATYLVSELDDPGRQEHFATLSAIANRGRLKIDDCITYYVNYKKWKNGQQEDLLPEWVLYVDQNSFRKGSLYELMIKIIQEKVSDSFYNSYLFQNILALPQESIEALSPAAAKTIRFADSIEGLNIDRQQFLKWYNRQLNRKLKNVNENSEKYKNVIEKEIQTLSQIDIGSLQLKNILKDIIMQLENERSRVRNQIGNAADEELENIGRKFQQLCNVSLNDFARELINIKNSMKYQSNEPNLNSNIDEWLNDYMSQNLITDRQFLEFDSFLDQIKILIDLKIYEKYKTAIANQLQKRKNIQKEKTYYIESLGTVLKNWLDLNNDMQNGFLSSENMVNVVFGLRSSQNIKAKQLQALLEFILVPQQVPEITEQYLDDLFEMRLLTVDHFQYLIKKFNGYDVKRIIDYYFKSFSPVKISGIYVANLINLHAPRQAKRIADAYKYMNQEEVALFVKAVKKRTNSDSFDDFDVSGDEKKESGFRFFKK